MRSYRFMFEYCGRVVRNLGYNLRITIMTYTHNTQPMFKSVLHKKLFAGFELSVHTVLHTLFLHFQSVNLAFYTSSTGLTKTTTYNK